MNWVRCVAMHLSHAKTLVLAGALGKRRFAPHYSERIEGKNPTLFCAGAIIENRFLNVPSMLFPPVMVE